MKKPIYKRWWFILLVVVVIIGALGGGEDEADLDKGVAQLEEQGGVEETSTDLSSKNDINQEKEPVQEIKEPEEPVEEKTTETLSQKNAVRMAETYLKTMPFSKSGLVDQLEFEGFSNEEATYAVNKISVDWKKQAVKSAEVYLDTMAFSRNGLIEQLEFEGFSNEEATYAVDEIGL
ncbi:MAG: Ltp family lipoprotein [Tissierellaceae bacterium]|nr:Ltp family lipoprotein [Tissierellaceae bacterium]